MTNVNFKGQAVKAVIIHGSFTDPRDPYTDSYVESGKWADGTELTGDECEELTEHLRLEGSMTDHWRCAMPDEE